ncbi:Putative SOS response-associated peptidase YedK [Variovorax sp. YR634]|uniref:SOS response-associated peptidase n=1 Tax=Variovorax sp. YR634 TaxID=1884385 RepID=UPI000898EE4C|nr:SOS response-associated peptidase family protein [Variovorax sp. YR634]SDX11679.1 Putative SOS response-associated peptidase YedK [Variovorax sp. YR634]
MCTRYISPDDYEIERAWHIGARTPERWVKEMHPLYKGPFLRRADVADYARELVVGQWGMIPPWSTSHIPESKPKKGEEKGKRLSTVNARTEGMEKSPTYKGAWTRGKRCIIPAASYDEPNWESGKNVWWRFRRADGAPWGLAGLWDTWTDLKTGEVWHHYTMLTMNADGHPLMSRMHKPDPKLPADQQDKRTVIPLEVHEFDRWLTCTVEEARAMLKVPPVDLFDAGPVEA